jgi:hypothetical protein
LRKFYISWGPEGERVLFMRYGVTKVKRETMKFGAHDSLQQKYVYHFLEDEGIN